MKKIIVFLSILSLVIGLASIKYFTILLDSKKSAIFVQGIFTGEDYADKAKLSEAADNIFIGEVVEITGSDEMNDIRFTQFAIRVTQNIKGAFLGDVTVSQQGGFYKEKGKLYLEQLEGDSLLEEGQMYMFATVRDHQKGWQNLLPIYGSVAIDTEEQKYKLIEEMNNVMK